LFGRANVLSLGAKLIGRTLGIGTSAVQRVLAEQAMEGC
jgi:hypothetical protein